MFLAPVMGHVLYGLPPDPADAEDSSVRLHNGDAFSPRDGSPHADRLERVRGVAAEVTVPLAIAHDGADGVSVDTRAFALRPAFVVVETPKTFIELPPLQFLSYLTHEGLHELVAARAERNQQNQPGREIYSKYIKVALSGADGSLRLLTSAVGLPVEIVPLAPGPIRIGNVLRVRILRDGRPAPGLQVRINHRAPGKNEPGDEIVGRSGEDGEFSFTVHQAGFWRLHTISMRAIKNEKADWESSWASLTLRL
jgi:hypothetical protein